MADRGRRRGAGRDADPDEAVVEFLETNGPRSFKVKELQRALGIPQSRYRSFRARVHELARAGRIAMLPRRRFASLKAAVQLEGTVEGVGQRARHVRLGDGTLLPLPADAVERVVPGDRVHVRRVRDGREVFAHVQRVVSAAPRKVFGSLQRVGRGQWVLIPELRVPGLSGGVFFPEGVAIDDEHDGALAQAWLDSFDPRTERPLVREWEVLGAEDHPQAAMSVRIARAGWPGAFGAEAEAEAGDDPHDDPPRRDLTADFVFTIDPLDAKDHDDAVDVVRTEDGGYVLGVHIADVAHRVKVGGALDAEALERATSVYPPGRVLPMLPHVLSSGACSLHHGVERDTVSVHIHYDADGRRRRIDLGLGRIRSRASLAYEHAEALLDDERAEVPEDRHDTGVATKDLADAVRRQHELALRLRGQRRELGSLFVERPERVFTFDEDGHVDEVHLRPSLRSHWIIEEFMLEANRAVAETLHRAGLPLLWRVHEDPDEQKVEDLVELLKQFGVRWTPKQPVSGHDFAQLFAMVEGREEAPLIHLLALRSLMKARYRAGWDRHFGLAFERYTHFTSPIRRYPDLHNQRWLHRLVQSAGQGGWIDDAPRVAGELAPARLARPADRADAERLADHCSDMEREAQILERDCADICAADALKPREGQDLDGMIVSVLRSGVFIELADSGLDGFVGVRDLGDEWFHHDPERHVLVGERSGRRFRLGQRVRVLLEYVDVRNGKTWVGDLRTLPEPASPTKSPRTRDTGNE